MVEAQLIAVLFIEENVILSFLPLFVFSTTSLLLEIASYLALLRYN